MEAQLFKLQEKIITGKEQEVLGQLYEELYQIALLFAPSRGYGIGELDRREDIAHDAAAEIIIRYSKDPKYRVSTSFSAVVGNAIRDRTRPKRKIDQVVDRFEDIGIKQ